MTRKRGLEVDEKQWWSRQDDLEPVMGVPSVAASPAPLPDTASYEPEPGLAMEQESPALDDDEELDSDYLETAP